MTTVGTTPRHPCSLPSVSLRRPLMACIDRPSRLVTLWSGTRLKCDTWKTRRCRGGTPLMTALIRLVALVRLSPLLTLPSGGRTFFFPSLVRVTVLPSAANAWSPAWKQPHTLRPVSMKRQPCTDPVVLSSLWPSYIPTKTPRATLLVMMALPATFPTKVKNAGQHPRNSILQFVTLLWTSRSSSLLLRGLLSMKDPQMDLPTAGIMPWK